MEAIKIFLILCLLFSIFNSINAAINAFTPTRVKTDTSKCSITIEGSWVNNNYPSFYAFFLNFVNGKKITCNFNSNKPKEINCPNVKGTINSMFERQFMDSDEQYVIKGYEQNIEIACSSSLYLNINILLLVGIIFILF